MSDDKSNPLLRLQHEMAVFAEERDWDKFHTPKNLAMALSGEVGELTELFQWLTSEQSFTLHEHNNEALSDELADIMLYLLRLADKCNIDIETACDRKIEKNRIKYPIEKCYGSAKKYDQL
ncbi:nucleotide pyrophosphohydrolase [Veronia pacifica]|uniref:Nucleotide pyrophosphohydrolase n=1 Tax=Veronia pacifica TaxID=1080227 RepID=A0A1C3ES81_9GAMM|nr:nucleotide pyrophosphohydrolase [Veronia pacifica]ODA36048.1 nucleotide pyrophosphohydrolase [Veronia pacifica]